MVHVIATIDIKPGQRAPFLAILQANVPAVLAEDGCRGYTPVVDVDSGLPAQGGGRPDTVTIIEQWDSLAALHAHLQAPHMLAYRAKVKDLVAGVTLRVMAPPGR